MSNPSNPRSVIAGSERPAPSGKRLGAADPGEQVEISIYLKDAPAASGATRQELRTARAERLKPVTDDLKRFAAEHGLTLAKEDAARRLVKLAGPVDRLEAAFGTKLERYEEKGCCFRARTGPLTLPSSLSDKIESVLGLDNRPIATSKIALPRNATAVSFFPSEIAHIYQFPVTGGLGKGQCIALIELGGGYRDLDTRTAFTLMDLDPPEVVAVEVSGGRNQPGEDEGADGEVALDIQVAGGAAPGAKIAVYFAPNSDQGFVDAISKAVHDEANAPSVMSISWGAPESAWTAQAIASMTAAFADAAVLGVSVFAASGDRLANDGLNDGKAHVDFPASSPYVVGCGGTWISAGIGKLAGEVVWKNEESGTGGGVSSVFARPDYQAHVTVPGMSGRGVPDVSADADPGSGYRVVLNNATTTIGGTSAAAPLWAGLFALLNEARGTPIGQPHAILYGNAAAMRDVTTGNNRVGDVGFNAGPGWDACTGLGSPNGQALLEAFRIKRSA